MKIYIIGQVGSGKTTLAKKISQKYNIKHYELDKIVWNDKTNTKRTNEEQLKIFNKIINKKSWIIEDVGRSIFKEAYNNCDYIYYLKLNNISLYYRVTKRWLKQILKIEESNYHQNIKSLLEMYKWLNNGLKKETEKINLLNKTNKLKILTKKDLKKGIY